MNNCRKVGVMIEMAILLSSLATYGQQRSLSVSKGSPLKLAGNVSWSGVVYLDRDVIITANAVLTIMPGTVVLIDPQLDRGKQNMCNPELLNLFSDAPLQVQVRHGLYEPLVEIIVLGTLNANGTEEMPIVFFATSEPQKGNKQAPIVQKEGKYLVGNLPIDPRAPTFREHSLWGGIQFPYKSKGTLKHCIIANAVAAVNAHSSHPILKNCSFANNRYGVFARSSNLVIDGCFIFRCREGADFIDYGRPTLRDTVITDCDTGINYLHTEARAFPTITNCVIAKANIGVQNRGACAVIHDTVVHECKYGLVVWGPSLPPALALKGNTFTPDTNAVTLYDSASKKRYTSIPKETFPENAFEPIIFEKPNYDYPPDGKWQKVNGVSNENKADNNENKAESSATFYGQKVTGTNILFLLDISGSMQGLRIEKLKTELKDMIINLSTRSSCEVNFIWFNKMIVAKDIGIKLNRPNVAKNLTRSFDQRYAGGSTNFERAWDEGLRVVRSSKIDVIYFLSDGKSKTPVPLIKEWYDRNKKTKLIINTVAIGLESELLEAIAKVGGGEYKCVP